MDRVDLAFDQALALEAAQNLRAHLDVGTCLRPAPELMSLPRRRGGSGGPKEAATRAGCVRIEATGATSREDAHRFYEQIGYARQTLHFLKFIGDDSRARQAARLYDRAIAG